MWEVNGNSLTRTWCCGEGKGSTKTETRSFILCLFVFCFNVNKPDARDVSVVSASGVFLRFMSKPSAAETFQSLTFDSKCSNQRFRLTAERVSLNQGCGVVTVFDQQGRRTGRCPVFDRMFSLQPRPRSKVPQPGLTSLNAATESVLLTPDPDLWTSGVFRPHKPFVEIRSTLLIPGGGAPIIKDQIRKEHKSY